LAPRVLMIDNYDSFTFNLVQYLRELGSEVFVFRNDAISVENAVRGVEGGAFSHLVVSPGPGGPREAGVSMEMIGALAGKVPVLGVCLGHQAMAEVFGGKVTRARRLMHGKPSVVRHDGQGVYAGLPNPIECGRYHSLCVADVDVPAGFVVTARTEEEEIMGMRHERWACEGVQFHPESVLTPEGKGMIGNFLKQRDGAGARNEG
jgi:anthranilate synthase/aminodeoxychorismate synthase-like glutamine amidotransferase